MKNLLLILFLPFASFAQESINSSGGEGANQQGSVSYSIGQSFYTNYSNQNASMDQGVQQTFDISSITGRDQEHISLEVSVYPNPTTDFIQLKIDEKKPDSQQQYELFDIQARSLKRAIIQHSITRISFNNLAKSTYYLKVMEGDKVIKTFKIIKH